MGEVYQATDTNLQREVALRARANLHCGGGAERRAPVHFRGGNHGVRVRLKGWPIWTSTLLIGTASVRTSTCVVPLPNVTFTSAQQ